VDVIRDGWITVLIFLACSDDKRMPVIHLHSLSGNAPHPAVASTELHIPWVVSFAAILSMSFLVKIQGDVVGVGCQLKDEDDERR